MHLLPSPSAGSGRWRLPLAGHSAALVAEVFLAADTASRETHLIADLAGDPALALWSICLAGEGPGPTPACLRDVIHWLAAHGLSALVWTEAEPATADLPAALRDHFGKLAEQSVYVAELARRHSAAASELGDDEYYLRGLLHNASDWLAAARVVPAADDDETRLLDRLQAAAPAIADRRGKDSRDANAASARRLAVAAHKRFLAAGPLPASFLPRLAEQLRRLRQFEASQQAARSDATNLEASPLETQKLETEKLESMAEFAAGAGHEINNPLAIIAGRAQMLLRDEADPERRRELAVINVQALRVHEMIADMMLFARPPQPELADVDLAALLAAVTAALAPKAAERRIQLSCEAPGPLPTRADAVQLTVALRTLCDNALEAIGSDGRVELSAQSFPDGLEIVVRDNGPGIPSDVRRHLFDPYYSGRSAGRGLGLGLAKCWRIVTNHGGRINVESRPGEGATFRIWLPRRADGR